MIDIISGIFWIMAILVYAALYKPISQRLDGFVSRYSRRMDSAAPKALFAASLLFCLAMSVLDFCGIQMKMYAFMLILLGFIVLCGLLLRMFSKRPA